MYTNNDITHDAGNTHTSPHQQTKNSVIFLLLLFKTNLLMENDVHRETPSSDSSDKTEIKKVFNSIFFLKSFNLYSILYQILGYILTYIQKVSFYNINLVYFSDFLLLNTS